MVYIIRRNGGAVWIGDYATPADALIAYRKELGSLALDYDAANPDWEEDLEYSCARLQ